MFKCWQKGSNKVVEDKGERIISVISGKVKEIQRTNSRVRKETLEFWLNGRDSDHLDLDLNTNCLDHFNLEV